MKRVFIEGNKNNFFGNWKPNFSSFHIISFHIIILDVSLQKYWYNNSGKIIGNIMHIWKIIVGKINQSSIHQKILSNSYNLNL